MSLFHQHFFRKSDTPDLLWCRCGEVRDMHRHQWEFYGKLSGRDNKIKGEVLKCNFCGLIKNHTIYD